MILSHKTKGDESVKILVACEESQAVTIELRRLGHEAYSCDIIECSGGHPEWHLQQDVTPLLREPWDMIIAFPPCTHLAVSGARFFEQKRKDGRQQQGIDFFMQFVNCDCEKIAIENPIGIMSSKYRKPDQIIQPYWFGDPAQKSTCLWLKGLPKLVPTNMIEPPAGKVYANNNRSSEWHARTGALPLSIRARVRSKTFPGIARAMAEQWAGVAE